MDTLIYFLQFLATPRLTHPHTDEWAGAYVNCWIRAESIEEAAEIALENIRHQQWIADDFEEAHEVDRFFYLDEEDALDLECFESAEVNGQAYIFHTWPIDEPEHDQAEPEVDQDDDGDWMSGEFRNRN